MPATIDPRSGVASIRSSARFARLTQLVSFGLVGGIAFVTDVGVYNVLRLTALDDKPIGAKVISVAVATVVAWLGNRYLTFRSERSRPAVREGVLFAGMNVIGLLIAAGCLYFSHYVLGYTSQLADNIAGNGVGLVLGTVFRFVAYRYIVFRPSAASDPELETAEAVVAAVSVSPLPESPSTEIGSPADGSSELQSSELQSSAIPTSAVRTSARS